MVRLRRNSPLWECPSEYSGRGAPRNKGDRLPTPKEMVEDEELGGETAEVTRYGFRFIQKKYLWYGVIHDVKGWLVLV